MKKIILILFAVVITSAGMLAQEQGSQPNKPKKSPEERAEMMTQKLTKELALNADQQVKVKAMILKRIQDRQAQMKQGKAEREKADAEIKSILTPEQYQAYQQKKEEMKQKRQEKRMAPSSPESNTPQPK